jgi:transcriptional regulator with XRE-family HTH domain
VPYILNGKRVMGRKPTDPLTVAKRAEIGQRLKLLRAALTAPPRTAKRRRVPGLRALCGRLGISVKTWGNYESGRFMPQERVLQVIVETGVNPRWLFSGNGEMFSRPIAELDRAAAVSAGE